VAINCVYCGGTHERPAEVKQCWADHQAGPERPQEPMPSPGPAMARRAADPGGRRREPARPSPGEGVPQPVTVQVRRGPDSLGRHVVVGPGQESPAEWVGTRRVAIGAADLDEPGPAVDALRLAAHAAESLTIELGTELAEPGEADDRDPYQVGVHHEFRLDELHHLLLSNSIDVRDPAAPRWGVVDAAVAAGATVDGPADVQQADGTPAWLDGGPVRHHDPVDGVPVVHATAVEHCSLTPPSPNTTVAELAPDQLAAVTHVGGAARIIAPAGSGKTRVLTERARHLVDVWCLPPSAVTLVAFNKRAQEEMRARTSDLRGLEVRTLNSIALAVVNGTPPFAPQQRQWRTVDEPDVRRLLARLVETPRRLNVDPIAPWIDALSLVRLGLVDPASVEIRYGGDVDGLTEVYPQYLRLLEREGAVDFDGQIHRAIRVLLTQPAARRAAQRACRILLVDEFQDLTPAHLLLIRLLAAPGGAVFGVGDDDQTIYGYNGADPAWLIEFGTWFPGSGNHPLEVNYRCPAGVVEVADRLLRHNRRRVPKTIRAASSVRPGWRTVVADDPVDASLAAVRAALDDGAAPSDVAVLTRVNATLAPVQVALVGAGIPITGGVGGEFMDRTAIRAALAWIRLAVGGPFAPADLGEALRRPSRALHPRVREWVAEQRDVDGLLRLSGRLTNEKDATRIEEFAGEIVRLRSLVTGAARTQRVIATLVDDIGLGGAVANLDRTRTGMNRSAQGDDLRSLAQLAALHDDPTTFEGWLRERLMARRSPDGVVLATVHRVKGQEWPHVVVHLADRDQFPHRLADDVEEERRLFHVAITRCSRAVTIVAEQPSPFVDELTTEPPDVLPDPVPSRPEPATAPSKRRERPDHPLLDRDRVFAVPGLVLVDQGHEWLVTGLEPEAAVAERNGATRRFRIGAKVETAGRQRGVLAARPGSITDASVVAFDELRRYRDRARNGKPAYTVFDDKTLAGIADALPADLAELARVKGVGPAKLEQYGDDIIDLVAAVTE
jgi:DNA helicase-2/ATP-dependent DNA helicase PcrA